MKDSAWEFGFETIYLHQLTLKDTGMKGRWKKPVEDILKELESKPKDKWTAFDFMVWGFLYCNAKIEEGIGMRMADRD